MESLPRLTLEDLERINGARYNNEHKCARNPLPDALFMVFCTSFGDEPINEWQLHHFWLSTEEQVVTGEYAEVGEVIASNAFVIAWCPFCGKALASRT